MTRIAPPKWTWNPTCIFCRSESSTSKTIEHIVPESLGNRTNILPRGVVCDSCNVYFGSKLEKPVLESRYFVHTRFRNTIPSKRGRVPVLDGIVGPLGIELAMIRDISGLTSIGAAKEGDDEAFLRYVTSHRKGTLRLPVPDPAPANLVSRLLAKIGLEILTQRLMYEPGWEDAVVFRKELDEVRNFARRGAVGKVWPIHERRIYEEHRPFNLGGPGPEEVLHEYTLLYTPTSELYAVIAILGVEYAINLGGPEIEGYMGWLDANQQGSCLYPTGIP